MRVSAILSVLLLCSPASAQKLSLSPGTMQLGGAALFSMDSHTPGSTTGAEVSSVSGFQLNVLPRFGIFVADNLELLVSGRVGTGFGDLYEDSPTTYGFDAGAAFYFATGGLAPYIGATVGLGFLAPNEGDTVTELNFLFPAGVLIALNEWVALDMGLRIIYSKSLEEGGGSVLSVPIGYLGVQAFFGGDGGGGDDW
jgi:hypothetical protein